MVRESRYRLTKWDKKIDPSIVLQRFTVLKDISKEQLDPYLIQVTGYEKRVKEFLEAKGIPTIQIASYLAYMRELLGKTFGSITGESLRKEERAIRSKWVVRGLDEEILKGISGMFGITEMITVNVLKGKIGTVMNFDINPENLEYATDEKFDTVTTWGKGKVGDKSEISYSFDITKINWIVFQVGVKTDNPELKPSFEIVVKDKDGVSHMIFSSDIDTSEEKIIFNKVFVGYEISEIHILINVNMVQTVAYLRVYEIQAFT
jgi:hypothetical protein